MKNNNIRKKDGNKLVFVFNPSEAFHRSYPTPLIDEDEEDYNGTAKAKVYEITNNGNSNASERIQEETSGDEVRFATEPTKWNVQEVTNWLKKEGFSNYTEQFQRHKIDGLVLVRLTEQDLRSPPLQLAVLGDIKRLHLAIEKLKKEYNINVKEPSSDSEEEREYRKSRDKKQKVIVAPKLTSASFPFTIPKVEYIDEIQEWSIGDKGSFPKLLFSITYLVSVCFLTAIVMTIVHDRVPDPTLYPPLPDIFLDLINPVPWAFEVTEMIILFLGTVLFIVLLTHKHRMVILKRFCAITGTVFLLRCTNLTYTFP